MIPSLFTFTLLAAIVLIAAGIPFLALAAKTEKVMRAFPRDRMTGIVTMLLGGGWFLWKISQLGQSDFGDYKNILLLLFAATLFGSIFYVRDFLAVRGVAILILLSANTGLKSAFGLYETPSRLILVTILYLFIVLALWYGIMPFKMRDTVNWLYRSTVRAKIMGIVFILMGSSLLLATTQY